MQYIHFFEQLDPLAARLETLLKSYSAVYVLVDENTQKHCLPLLPILQKQRVINIAPGEKSKTMISCRLIWEILTKANADRHSVIVNLGGGMILDMGGFAASCYKRGIDFIHIPTTSLAMLDAAVGGKTAIDFLGFKNQLGVFAQPKEVLVSDVFLDTLPEREFNAGLAEMIKHLLIADKSGFEKLYENLEDFELNIKTIEHHIRLKETFTIADPREENIRKALNFGHSLGHAIESFYLKTEEPLLHGEAIAFGIILEAYISLHREFISEEDLMKILEVTSHFFDLTTIDEEDITEIITYCFQDKKNMEGELIFTLLNGIGNYKINEAVVLPEIEAAFRFYENLLDEEEGEE